jgi:hypothetical protein
MGLQHSASLSEGRAVFSFGGEFLLWVLPKCFCKTNWKNVFFQQKFTTIINYLFIYKTLLSSFLDIQNTNFTNQANL